MNDREKLIDVFCAVLGADPDYRNEEAIQFVDELIANGVTVQPKDGCDYCREDADGYRRAFGAFSLHNPFHNGEWEISTGHCKPRRIYFCPMCGRKLPEPPKGE